MKQYGTGGLKPENGREDEKMVFQNLIFHENAPVSIQVIDYFKKQIILGRAEDGDELPSRRQLAAALGINPTTAQKIYRQMEEEHLIETLPNSKTYLRVTPQKREELKRELLEGAMKRLLREVKECGLDFRQMVELAGRLWDEC